MKKPSIILLIVVTFLLVFQMGDASPQQVPDATIQVPQVPGRVSSQEAFDELVVLVSKQTKAIRFLAMRIEELEARVLELENSGEE